DWVGTRIQITDPIPRQVTPVSVFVASLPYSGLVFAYRCLDAKFPAWADAHRRAFEYLGGVSLPIIPDDASNQLSKDDRTQDVNSAYSQFLEHYQTAAVPTRSAAPRDKGHVEAGVKVV